MWEKINNFLKGQIVTSIIYIALGACLVFMPVSTDLVQLLNHPSR